MELATRKWVLENIRLLEDYIHNQKDEDQEADLRINGEVNAGLFKIANIAMFLDFLRTGHAKKRLLRLEYRNMGRSQLKKFLNRFLTLIFC